MWPSTMGITRAAGEERVHRPVGAPSSRGPQCAAREHALQPEAGLLLPPARGGVLLGRAEPRLPRPRRPPSAMSRSARVVMPRRARRRAASSRPPTSPARSRWRRSTRASFRSRRSPRTRLADPANVGERVLRPYGCGISSSQRVISSPPSILDHRRGVGLGRLPERDDAVREHFRGGASPMANMIRAMTTMHVRRGVDLSSMKSSATAASSGARPRLLYEHAVARGEARPPRAARSSSTPAATPPLAKDKLSCASRAPSADLVGRDNQGRTPRMLSSGSATR